MKMSSKIRRALEAFAISAIFAIFAIFAMTVPLGASQARADTESGPGNGGDRYAREFVSLGYEILARLAQNPVPQVDSARLAVIVAQTKVRSMPSLTLKGYAVSAINYPQANPPYIEVSRTDWEKMDSARHEKMFLVFHEYLSLLGVDDSSYQVSHLFDEAQVCFRTRQIREKLESIYGISCDRILPSDLAKIEELNLRGSDIAILRASDFRFLSGLRRLNLEETQMSDWPDDLFSELPVLEQLNLRNARLTNVRRGMFASAPHLQGLELGINHITQIEPDSFANLPDLKYLGLAHNDLKRLEADTFRGALRFDSLHNPEDHDVNELGNYARTLVILSDNDQLVSIDPHAFSGTQVNELYLEGTALTGRIVLNDASFFGIIVTRRSPDSLTPTFVADIRGKVLHREPYPRYP